jgi:hypothetical protein
MGAGLHIAILLFIQVFNQIYFFVPFGVVTDRRENYVHALNVLRLDHSYNDQMQSRLCSSFLI